MSTCSAKVFQSTNANLTVFAVNIYANLINIFVISLYTIMCELWIYKWIQNSYKFSFRKFRDDLWCCGVGPNCVKHWLSANCEKWLYIRPPGVWNFVSSFAFSGGAWIFYWGGDLTFNRGLTKILLSNYL